MRVALLVSPSAEHSTAPGLRGRAGAALTRLGSDVVELRPDRAEAITGLVADAVADGATRVVVVGGDGTLHHVLPAIAGTEIALGLVPVGTGNDFARALGVRGPGGGGADPYERALGDAVPVDLARSSHGWYATIGTCGFSADVNERANAMRWPRGERRYTLATILEVRHLRPFPISIGLDDTALEIDVSFVAVGNTAYFGGGMAICDGADAYDGSLDVTVVGATGRLEMLRFLPRVTAGLPEHPNVSTYRSRRVTLTELTPRVPTRQLWADGEPVGPLPVEIECVPGALLVAGA